MKQKIWTPTIINKLDSVLAVLLGVVFVATVIRSTFGFGEALIAVPLLSFLVPVKEAAPLAAALSITVAASIVVQDWRHIHIMSVGWFLAPGVVGIPLGAWLLRQTNPLAAKLILAAAIISFSVYILSAKNPPKIEKDHRGALAASGFLAGIFGGLFGMNGPPLIAYATLRGWTPEQTRATLQGYFLPAGLIGLASYSVGGLWTMNVTHLYLMSLIAAIPGLLVGRYLNTKLDRRLFVKWVYGGLICAGVALLAESLSHWK